MKAFALPAAFVLGLIIAAQLAINAATASQVQNLRLNNAVFWVSGGVAALLVGLTGWDAGFWPQARALPAWQWCAGVMGALIVIAIAWFILRLGAGVTNILMLAGQVVGSLIIAHYGVLGTPQDRLTPVRVAGVVLMLAGAMVAVMGRPEAR